MFHSFRHTMEDACRRCRMDPEHRDYMIGHDRKNMSDKYGLGFDVPTLAESMSKVRHEGLDLSHLHWPNAATKIL